MTTNTHISDDVGQPDAVTADGNSYEITIRPRNPIDYRVYAPNSSVPFILRTGGEPFSFRRSDREGAYLNGQIVGYTEILSGGGTQTFDKFAV